SVDDLRRWNDLDAGARLEEGMTLQVFVARDADLSRIVVVPESEARVVPVGSEDFFASSDLTKGIKRVTIAAKTGDTLEAIGKRFGVSSRTMERINRRGRGEALKPGEPVVVYVPGRLVAAAAVEGAAASGAGSSTATASNAATPGAPVPNAPAANGPLPEPPVPDLLP
ncbi:MAG TPA: LysM peptidoglycan-binding domain-containing protein, partial [Polyangiaceae bacterium]|nr:LysM peptidoglycan-binding domain-containing protein [Polyangiaceae bacterium]